MELATSSSNSNHRDRISFPSNINFDNESENVDINFNLMKHEDSTDGFFKWKLKNKSIIFSALAIFGVSVALNCVVLLIFWMIAVNPIKNSSQPLQPKSETSKLDFNFNKKLIFKYIFFKKLGLISTNSCGDWTIAYNDVKCLKVFDQMETYSEAEKLCQMTDPSAKLLNIQTESEQEFIEKHLLAELGLFNPVWLGGQWSDTSYEFEVNSQKLTFRNWAEGSPNRVDERKCIQLLAEHHTTEVDGNRGRWVNVRCQAKGSVVCQKLQHWPQVKFQESLLRANIEAAQQQKTIKKLQFSLDESVKERQKELETAKESLLPVGFIYVQLPKEAPPTEIWPQLNWTDVSSVYAGVFFRVAGEGATEFGGKVQESSAPKLVGVKLTDDASNKPTYAQIQQGKWSDGLYVKARTEANAKPSNSHNDLKSLRFLVEGSEVRPKNMAIKVWKRVG